MKLQRVLLTGLIALIVCLPMAACSADVQSSNSIAASPSCDPASYTLNVHRNFGYSSGKQIKGNFSMAVNAPAECISQAVFMIDGNPIATVKIAPFEIVFETTSYSYGLHQLSASVTPITGSAVVTPLREFEFATAQEEGKAVTGLVFPILGGTLAIITVMVLLQVVVIRRRSGASVEPGSARNYGISGGAICPKCGRPFPLHLFAPHFGFTKFDRCDNCGKWSLVKPASPDELREAEKREIQVAQAELPNQEKREEDELKKKIDDSRYLN